ncbi:MAG: 2-methylfumaryl-CoA isomerase [Gammaproteobacteria bacterium]|jgi:2-methylfumaryl-CoA isomerase
MYSLLDNFRVVEGASFIAAPSCTLQLAQMGAEVIRFDHVRGGPDYGRWPCTEDGTSLYWEGLNKGKKSIAIDLGKPEGRELAIQLATAPGEGRGMFVTNYPVGGFLSHDNLVKHRADMITVRVMGWADGSTALDYTVNAGVGYPMMTGPASMGDTPVNHVLPAWDLIAGTHAAMALVSAERHRSTNGKGEEIRVPLGDVALSTLGHLGHVAEATVMGQERERLGNDLYGAFGRDFEAADGRRVMICAITSRQWRGLLDALQVGEQVAVVENELGVSFEQDEGLRFAHRERLNSIIEAAAARHSSAQLATLLDEGGVCWEPYRTMREAVAEKCRPDPDNPHALFRDVAHPSGHTYPTPGTSFMAMGMARQTPVRAPRLGEHTDEVLASVMGMAAHEIGRLHDTGVVAGG